MFAVCTQRSSQLSYFWSKKMNNMISFFCLFLLLFCFVFFFCSQLNKPSTSNQGNGASTSQDSSSQNGADSTTQIPSDIFDFYEKIDKEEEEGEDLETVSFEVKQDEIENLQRK